MESEPVARIASTSRSGVVTAGSNSTVAFFIIRFTAAPLTPGVFSRVRRHGAVSDAGVFQDRPIRLSGTIAATYREFFGKQEIRDQIVATIPMGRLAQPGEIAAVVAFLASEEAGYITGANISVNGGMHMM